MSEETVNKNFWEGSTDYHDASCILLDGKYFKVFCVDEKGKVEAECKLCTKKCTV